MSHNWPPLPGLNPLTSSRLAGETSAPYLLAAFDGLGIRLWIRLAKAVTKQLNRADEAASTPFVPSNCLFKLSVPLVLFFLAQIYAKIKRAIGDGLKK